MLKQPAPKYSLPYYDVQRVAYHLKWRRIGSLQFLANSSTNAETSRAPAERSYGVMSARISREWGAATTSLHAGAKCCMSDSLRGAGLLCMLNHVIISRERCQHHFPPTSTCCRVMESGCVSAYMMYVRKKKYVWIKKKLQAKVFFCLACGLYSVK